MKNIQLPRWLFIMLLVLLVTSLLTCVRSAHEAEQGKPLQNKVDVDAVHESYTFPLSLFYLLRHSLQMADAWFVQNQRQDGSWQSDPLLSSFVLYALVEKPGDRQEPGLEAAIAKGFRYLKGFYKNDGSFTYQGARRYLTAAALLAFAAYNQPDYQDIIKNARQYLIHALNDEEEGYSPGDRDYGGLGYGTKPSDLTGTQLALEAIKAAEPAVDSAASRQASQPAAAPETYLSKVLIFITHCQSTQPDTAGGFASLPADQPPAQEPYPVCGSMTYTGLKGLLDAGLAPADARVRNALAWVRKHYTLQEDPGLKPAHIYFYYMLMAKALSLTGTNTLADDNTNEKASKNQNERTREHFWREELASRIISLQKGEGYWQDEVFASQTKSLDTAYAVIALKSVLHGLEMKAIR